MSGGSGEKVSVAFWGKWLGADELERYEMARVLAEKIDAYTAIDDRDVRIRCIAALLKAYFEDLEEALKR